MKIINTVEEMKLESSNLIRKGKTIGFTPTMGALHEGHLSLISESVKNNENSIVSIFVNPIQFGENEDLDKYPVKIEEDFEKVKTIGADIVFYPNKDEMYKTPTITKIEMPIFNMLCGEKRKGHFSGVCVVVSKLMNIINPTNMYMGMKDYQQLMVINRLIEDLSFNVNLVGMPIIRDKDGLALSSRNEYLSSSEKANALVINKSRHLVKNYVNKNLQTNVNTLKELISKNILDNGLKIDYVELKENGSLENTKKISNTSRIFIAVYSGTTRLIDNFSVEECLSL